MDFHKIADEFDVNMNSRLTTVIFQCKGQIHANKFITLPIVLNKSVHVLAQLHVLSLPYGLVQSERQTGELQLNKVGQ